MKQKKKKTNLHKLIGNYVRRMHEKTHFETEGVNFYHIEKFKLQYSLEPQL
jgi:hypothetical protein